MGLGIWEGECSSNPVRGREEGRTLERKAVNVVWDKLGLNCPTNGWEN